MAKKAAKPRKTAQQVREFTVVARYYLPSKDATVVYKEGFPIRLPVKNLADKVTAAAYMQIEKQHQLARIKDTLAEILEYDSNYVGDISQADYKAALQGLEVGIIDGTAQAAPTVCSYPGNISIDKLTAAAKDQPADVNEGAVCEWVEPLEDEYEHESA